MLLLRLDLTPLPNKLTFFSNLKGHANLVSCISDWSNLTKSKKIDINE